MVIGLAACGAPDPGSEAGPGASQAPAALGRRCRRAGQPLGRFDHHRVARQGALQDGDRAAGRFRVHRTVYGYIVTNNHVVERAREIKVHLASGETYDAEVVGRDPPPGDLALLKIDAEDLPVAPFDESGDLRVGDWVISIGNALSLKGSPTVTLGIVSALGRTVPTQEGTFYDMIQTDAAINTGSSGGPLVNLRGEVVGINQALLPRAQGMGFAQSATVAKRIVDSLLEHGRAMRPLIGLMGADVTPAIANELGLGVEQGVIVTHMSQTEPAYKAGIRVQDVITALDGVPTPDMASFLTLLQSYAVGDRVTVDYLHENEERTATLELAERRS